MLVSEAISLVRDHLGQNRDSLNRLDGAVGTGDGSVTLEFASPMPAQGSVVEARSAAGAELMYVWAVSGQDLTVQRAFAGTTALAFADGDIVAIDPVVSDARVNEALLAELRALPSEGLGRVTTTSLSYSYALEGYDTSAVTDMITPLAINMTISARDQWVYDFVEAPGLIRPYGYTTPDSAPTLHYRTVFAEPADFTDDLATDCFVPVSAQDIVPIGAAIRLVYSQEQLRGRADVQVHARASEDVQPGSGARSVGLLQQWKSTRLAHEQRRIREVYPRRRL